MSGVLVVASLPHWLSLRALPPPFYLFVSADSFQPRARSALSKQNNKSKFYFYFLISFCFKTTNSSVLFLPCFCCSSEKQTVVSRLLFSCSPVRLVEVLSFYLSTSLLILVLHFHFFSFSIYFSTLNSKAVAWTEAGETFDWLGSKAHHQAKEKNVDVKSLCVWCHFECKSSSSAWRPFSLIIAAVIDCGLRAKIRSSYYTFSLSWVSAFSDVLSALSVCNKSTSIDYFWSESAGVISIWVLCVLFYLTFQSHCRRRLCRNIWRQKSRVLQEKKRRLFLHFLVLLRSFFWLSWRLYLVVLPFNLFSVPFSFTTAAPTLQLFFPQTTARRQTEEQVVFVVVVVIVENYVHSSHWTGLSGQRRKRKALYNQWI